MGELLRRFRYPLAYLLLAALCVIAMVSERRPAQLSLASRALVAVTLPLERMVTLPVHEAQGWWEELVVLVPGHGPESFFPALARSLCRTNHNLGVLHFELYFCASDKHRQAVLVARLDNLGKGASGAAVQNMRLMLGLADK